MNDTDTHPRSGKPGPAAAAVSLLLIGCAGPQSTLDPQGPVAAAIATAWWTLFGGAVAILAGVIALVLHATFRTRASRAPTAPLVFLAGAGVAFPVVVLTALLVYGTDLGRRITEAARDPLRIEVTGHRWWWEIRYVADDEPEVITANELRLPTGVPIEFSIRSADVIHSFWIPNLGGKVDMIPGRTNTLRVLAATPGRFRAQCSEFCGAQHAGMNLVVIAESESEFQQWRRARASAAAVSSGPGLARFVDRGCAACHAIAGTPAAGTGGPVLTHFASRPAIGSAAVRNTPESLRAWLRDHGATLKPGSLGPAMRVADPADVETLAHFLEQLR